MAIARCMTSTNRLSAVPNHRNVESVRQAGGSHEATMPLCPGPRGKPGRPLRRVTAAARQQSDPGPRDDPRPRVASCEAPHFAKVFQQGAAPRIGGDPRLHRRRFVRGAVALHKTEQVGLFHTWTSVRRSCLENPQPRPEYDAGLAGQPTRSAEITGWETYGASSSRSRSVARHICDLTVPSDTPSRVAISR